MQALRLFSLTAAVIPVALGTMLASGSGHTRWGYVPLAFLGALLLQAGTNVINDVYDYRNGVDSPVTLGDSGVFTSGVLSDRAGWWYGVGLFGAAATIGIVLSALRGWPVLLIGAVAVLSGYFYTGGPRGYKYLALGDAAVFLLMGPLMVAGTYYVLAGDFWVGRVILTSLPIGFLVTAILEANNLRYVETDRQVHVHTMVTVMGFQPAKVEYAISIGAAYAIVALLAVTRVLSWWSLIVLVTVPMAQQVVRMVLSARPGARRLNAALPRTAMLHMAFGALLVLGVAIGALAASL